MKPLFLLTAFLASLPAFGESPKPSIICVTRGELLGYELKFEFYDVADSATEVRVTRRENDRLSRVHTAADLQLKTFHSYEARLAAFGNSYHLKFSPNESPSVGDLHTKGEPTGLIACELKGANQ